MRLIKVQSAEKGIQAAKELLYKNCSKDTILFLSGGSTPAPLYKKLAIERKLKVGAFAMVDDRYSMHEQYSNEFMIRESGLVLFLEKKNVPFYPILRYGLNRAQTAREYEKDVKFLFEHFKKKIGILGVGADGHIASLPVGIKNLKFKIKNLEYVSYTNTFPIEPRVPRISLNMNALSLMDLLIIIVFGEEKKEGIEKAFKTFFKGSILKKTILITEQKV